MSEGLPDLRRLEDAKAVLAATDREVARTIKRAARHVLREEIAKVRALRAALKGAAP